MATEIKEKEKKTTTILQRLHENHYTPLIPLSFHHNSKQ